MKFFRNFILSVFSIFLLLGLSACGAKQQPNSNQGTSQKQQSNKNTRQSSNNFQTSQSQLSTGIKSGTSRAAIKYKTYHNQEFGYTIQYPMSWKVSSTGNGRSYSTPTNVSSFDNGMYGNPPKTDAVLLVQGVINSGQNGKTFKQLQSLTKTIFSNYKKQTDTISTEYKVVPNKGVWITTVSKGKKGTNAFEYLAKYMTLKSTQIITFIYPESEKGKYQPIIQHIVQTFKPGTTAKNTLEGITFGESSITLDLLHGKMQSTYQNPHIISSGNTHDFVVALHNVTQGKYALDKKIPVSKSLANYYILTKKGSDLILTCNLKKDVNKVQTGITGFQMSFKFVK